MKSVALRLNERQLTGTFCSMTMNEPPSGPFTSSDILFWVKSASSIHPILDAVRSVTDTIIVCVVEGVSADIIMIPSRLKSLFHPAGITSSHLLPSADNILLSFPAELVSQSVSLSRSTALILLLISSPFSLIKAARDAVSAAVTVTTS